MKKSIFKKLVSVVSVLAMVISCTATVLAANEYASQSSPCETDKTNWVFKRNPGTGQGVSMTALGDGTYKMERTMFRTSTTECGIYGLTKEEGYYNGTEMWYKASADGTKWEAVANPPNWGSADNMFANYSFANSKTFTKGTVQTKFDFAFEEDSNQCITIGFIGASATNSSHYVGARIFRDNIRFWFPKNDGTSSSIYYNAEKTKLPCDKTWYTGILKYDMDSKVIALSLKSRDDDSFSFTRKFSIGDTTQYWGSDTPGAISGVTFASYRGIDQSVISTTPNPATSVWYIDNVSLDAYTETNYAINSVFRNAAGVETNKADEGFDFKGFTLNKFTNVADSADARFITASYANDGRMIEAVAKPLSEVGSVPVNADITGDKVKSFILGMNDAKPYVDAYEYADPATTVRKYDFEEGYTAPGTGNGMAITKVAEGDNNIIKFERTGFGSGYRIAYTDGEWKQTTDSPDAKWVTLPLGETVTSYEASFKLKFAGFDNPSGYQSCQFNLGKPDSAALIQRKSDGKISVSTDYDGGKSDMFVLGENEWCEVTIKVALGAQTKVDWTFKKDGVVVATFSQTVDRQNLSAGTSSVYIGSRRDNDMIGLAKDKTDFTGYNTTSSVWYIDDLVVKY